MIIGYFCIIPSNKASETVGFVGLGNMGMSMAKNLLKNGFQVVAYDISADANAVLSKEGAKIVGSPREVAESARKIVSMVPASAHMQDVYCGDSGILKAGREGDIYVDASTIDPHVAKYVSEQVKAIGARMLDTPVSGGVTGAANGTLTFMVGGEKETLESIRPVLEAMGKKITYCGGNGSGQIVKVSYFL